MEGVTVSINRCPYCDKHIDEDFDLEHYETCRFDNFDHCTNNQWNLLKRKGIQYHQHDRQFNNILKAADYTKVSKAEFQELLDMMFSSYRGTKEKRPEQLRADIIEKVRLYQERG